MLDWSAVWSVTAYYYYEMWLVWALFVYSCFCSLKMYVTVMQETLRAGLACKRNAQCACQCRRPRCSWFRNVWVLTESLCNWIFKACNSDICTQTNWHQDITGASLFKIQLAWFKYWDDNLLLLPSSPGLPEDLACNVSIFSCIS